MILYGIALLMIILSILFVMYLIVMKYHQHLREIINSQTALLRTVTNLAVSKNLETFSALQLTSVESSGPTTPSNFDTNLINEQVLVKQFQEAYSGDEFNAEFGGF